MVAVVGGGGLAPTFLAVTKMLSMASSNSFVSLEWAALTGPNPTARIAQLVAECALDLLDEARCSWDPTEP